MSELRGSSASATHATDEYQGSCHGATTSQANVSAQVAATTVGTSGESRLYRYQASSSMSGGQVNPITVVTGARRGCRRLLHVHDTARRWGR